MKQRNIRDVARAELAFHDDQVPGCVGKSMCTSDRNRTTRTEVCQRMKIKIVLRRNFTPLERRWELTDEHVVRVVICHCVEHGEVDSVIVCVLTGIIAIVVVEMDISNC